MREAKIMVRLCVCAGSPKPSLIDNVTSNNFISGYAVLSLDEFIRGFNMYQCAVLPRVEAQICMDTTRENLYTGFVTPACSDTENI